MNHGLDSDLLLVGLSSVAVVADRALHGSNGMRRALAAPLLFAANLLLDLIMALDIGLAHPVQAAFALVGLLVYIVGGGALVVALIGQFTRPNRPGGGMPALGRFAG